MKEVFRLGIIGAGKFSHRHIRAIAKEPRIKLVAACRSEKKELQDFCQRYRLDGYTDYRRLLADPLIDIVLVATPHHLHAEMTVAAAKAGKHILLEKPFATNLNEARYIDKVVQHEGIKLLLGQVSQFTAAFQTALAYLNSGQLGSIVQASATSHTYWMGPDRKPWHLNQESGGGYLLTLGVHQLDLLITLISSRVVSVRATIGSSFHVNEVDDRGNVWLRFHNGLSATLMYSGFKRGVTEVEVKAFCTMGILKVEASNGAFIGRDGTWTMIPGSAEKNHLDLALEREWQELLKALDEDRIPNISCQQGLHLMEVIDAIQMSSRLERAIQISETGELAAE